jgi:hypothetical protein
MKKMKTKVTDSDHKKKPMKDNNLIKDLSNMNIQWDSLTMLWNKLCKKE